MPKVKLYAIKGIPILLALPSSSSGQGGPTGTRGLSHAEISLLASDNHHSCKTHKYIKQLCATNLWVHLLFAIVDLPSGDG